jgi:hypothetical protein
MTHNSLLMGMKVVLSGFFGVQLYKTERQLYQESRCGGLAKGRFVREKY